MPLPGDTVETGGAGESGNVCGCEAELPADGPRGDRGGPGEGGRPRNQSIHSLILTNNLGLDPGGNRCIGRGQGPEAAGIRPAIAGDQVRSLPVRGSATVDRPPGAGA